ncbi:hypothetical protein CALCODRAFT_450083 [Calocera cornea HHB12733]|uniref:Cysteine-rich PDZ-binding protein n=1 Tax=Calocera cornea HHB12733 TaxID=1353952 RepID=A0A165HM30_9BASI|nr:hypothetical protein CALCODRAFT_450083 [Calocera cornea HHB12733]
MVCAKCEKKVSKLATSDPFSPSTSQGRKVGENKLLSSGVGPSALKSKGSLAGTRYTPYGGKCRDCKSTVTQNGAKYCHGCAFKKGACSICGKKILDTKQYNMSAK